MTVAQSPQQPTTVPTADLTVTLTPGEQIVFRRALQAYHQERRRTFAATVETRRSGDQKVPLADSMQRAIVLSLIETCRAKMHDDTWSADAI
jgi:hypothetical protein